MVDWSYSRELLSSFMSLQLLCLGIENYIENLLAVYCDVCILFFIYFSFINLDLSNMVHQLQVSMQTYSLDANLCLLRLYQVIQYLVYPQNFFHTFALNFSWHFIF